MSTRIAHYRFEDSKRNLLAVAALHFFLMMLFLMPQAAEFLEWGRAQLCAMIALGLAVAYYRYDWRSSAINWSIFTVYVVILVLEWVSHGVPEDIVAKPVSVYASKGALLDVILNLMPPLYVGLRVTCAGLIAWVAWNRPAQDVLADSSTA